MYRWLIELSSEHHEIDNSLIRHLFQFSINDFTRSSLYGYNYATIIEFSLGKNSSLLWRSIEFEPITLMSNIGTRCVHDLHTP